MTFSCMAVVSLMVVMPASMASDQVGRKWTIIPSCLGMAAALSLMAFSGHSHTHVCMCVHGHPLSVAQSCMHTLSLALHYRSTFCCEAVMAAALSLMAK